MTSLSSKETEILPRKYYFKLYTTWKNEVDTQPVRWSFSLLCKTKCMLIISRLHQMLILRLLQTLFSHRFVVFDGLDLSHVSLTGVRNDDSFWKFFPWFEPLFRIKRIAKQCGRTQISYSSIIRVQKVYCLILHRAGVVSVQLFVKDEEIHFRTPMSYIRFKVGSHRTEGLKNYPKYSFNVKTVNGDILSCTQSSSQRIAINFTSCWRLFVAAVCQQWGYSG